MPRNVEIKARLRDPAAVAARARTMATAPVVLIRQRDTFLTCPAGRLKLREFGDGTGELIFYNRPDAPALLKVMQTALPVRGVVAKTRTLVMCGRTRIHLDEVEELGSFLELEVVLAVDEAVAEGEAEARRLLADLGIEEGDLIEGAYLDLMESSPHGDP